MFNTDNIYRRYRTSTGWSVWNQIGGKFYNPIGQQTLTFNIVASGASKSLTVPYKGVTTNDLVICNPKSALPSGFSYNCYVSNNDEITVTIHNFSGTQQSLATGINFTFAVIKRGSLLT